MAWFNEEVAALLREYADLLPDHRRRRVPGPHLREGGPVGRRHPATTSARLDVTALRAIPGVGESIAEKIAEYLRAPGSIRALEELRAKIPAGVRELTAGARPGPEGALPLYQELGIASVDELAAAIEAGRLDGLAGFGAKTEENDRCTASSCTGRAAGGCCSTWRMALAEEIVAALSAASDASAAPTPARCAGCGRPSATSTSWPRPPTRRR